MLPGPGGAYRLFTAFGINVYLHWTWFLLAAFAVQFRPHDWSAGERLAAIVGVFGIVLLHEFGHSLACRSVGGRADQIVLWPLGGVAFVQPPVRPGAVLWSIVAGPLVNVLLAPAFYGAWLLAGNLTGDSQLTSMLWLLWQINMLLLIFNMLPVYPLDGGQTLQALLWFVVGRVRSLRIAAWTGVVIGVAAGVAMLVLGDIWLLVLAVFVVMRSWQGVRLAELLARAEAAGIPIEDPRGARRRDWQPPV